jgi:fumiquinazoline A oxidase
LQIRIAAAHNIPFFTTGGGHGISDYSAFHGISIDLGNFNSVVLDLPTNRLTIGGSVQYSQLTELLYNAGKELRMTSCSASVCF